MVAVPALNLVGSLMPAIRSRGQRRAGRCRRAERAAGAAGGQASEELIRRNANLSQRPKLQLQGRAGMRQERRTRRCLPSVLIINAKEMKMKSMKTAITLALLALFASYSAVAQTPTRSEVKKEGVAAMKSDKILTGEEEKQEAMKSTKKRAEVKKEGVEAAKAGEIALNAPPKKKVKEPKSDVKRADVKKEGAAALKADDIAAGDKPVKK
jgi:hypothetical protein